MEGLFILVCLVLSIFALINSTNVSARLSYRILNLEKEIARLREHIRILGDKGSTAEAFSSSEDLRSSSSEQDTVPNLESVQKPATPTAPQDSSPHLASTPPPFAPSPDHQLPEYVSFGSRIPKGGTVSQPSAQHTHSTPKKPRSSSELEALIGGKLLNRIGALAMIIAVGFFLKYAFENNWINEWTRVSMGAVFGVGMLFLANHFHRKELTVFAQGLVGVGVSSLYLSVYAAYNFYQLMPQLPAFVLMMAITVIAFLQALKYDSLAAAVMATAGGFLTPLLLPTAHPNEVGLFTYMALLDVGILILVVAKERWVLIEHIARIATYLIYFSWFQEYYLHSDIALTLFHLILFWCLFFGGEFYRLYTQKLQNRIWLTAGSIMNALAFFTGLMMIIDGPYHEHSGWVTFLLGAVYFGTFHFLRKQGKTDKHLEIHYLLTAILLLIISTGLQFEQYDLVASWSIVAGILVWCSVRWRMHFVGITALALFALVSVQLLACRTFPTYDYTAYYHFIFNDRSFGLWAFLLSLFGASLVVRRSEENAFKYTISYVLTYGWIIVLFAWLSVETNDYFGSYINYNTAIEVWTKAHYSLEMAFGYVWASYGLLLFLGALWRKNRIVLQASMLVTLAAYICVTINSMMYKPITDFTLLLNVRAGLLLYMFLVLGIQYSILRKQELIHRYIGNAYGILLLLLVFELLSVETFSYYEQLIVEFGSRTGTQYYDSNYMIALNNTRQLMLSVVWLVYSIFMMVIGFWRKKRGLRLASITLSGIVILKVFIFDLHFLTLLNRIISFFGLGVILLLTSYIYQRFKHILLADESAIADSQRQKE